MIVSISSTYIESADVVSSCGRKVAQKRKSPNCIHTCGDTTRAKTTSRIERKQTNHHRNNLGRDKIWCLLNDLTFAVAFLQLPGWYRLKLFNSLSTGAFPSGISSLGASE